jgi:hypothetical protein
MAGSGIFFDILFRDLKRQIRKAQFTNAFPGLTNGTIGVAVMSGSNMTSGDPVEDNRQAISKSLPMR